MVVSPEIEELPFEECLLVTAMLTFQASYYSDKTTTQEARVQISPSGEGQQRWTCPFQSSSDTENMDHLKKKVEKHCNTSDSPKAKSILGIEGVRLSK